MVLSQIYEGTVEEIAAQLRRSDLTGNLRAIILSDEDAQPNGTAEYLDSALAELLRETDRVIPEAPARQTDPYEIAFGEIVTEKYKKMGFKL
jgi:hypothetical protein